MNAYQLWRITAAPDDDKRVRTMKMMKKRQKRFVPPPQPKKEIEQLRIFFSLFLFFNFFPNTKQYHFSPKILSQFF